MLLLDFPELRLQHDEVLALLRIEWVGGQDMTRFREGSLHLASLGRDLRIRHYLFDMNSLPDLSAHDQIWLGVNWLRKILALPMDRVVFLLSQKRVYQQAAVETLLRLAGPFMKFDFQFFDDPRQALGWLSNDSDRLPALLLEWEATSVPEPCWPSSPATPPS